MEIALALAQFAPSILRYFGVGEKNVAVADKVAGIAQVVTGTGTAQEALDALRANAQLQITFQQRVLEMDSLLEQAYLQDRADARKRDTAFLAAGTRNYRADLLTFGCWVVIAFVAWKIWAVDELNEFVKATLSLILGRFLGYLDQVFQFEFGSTRSNKNKDETIVNLTRVKDGISQ